MSNGAQILRAKLDQALCTVPPGASVLEALTTMAEKDIGALPLVSVGKLIGIVSERNDARKVALAGRASRNTPVADIKDDRVWHVAPHDSRERCMVLMTEKRVRHLAVIDDGRLAGLISIGDVVMGMITEQQFTIDQLERYLAGVRG